jgi:hypothetical protein
MEMNVRRFVGLGLMLAPLACVTLASPAGGDSAPVVVTTDTPEYCHKLMDRVTQALRAAAMPPPVEVAALSNEGEHMCNDGLTRGGILRLRRALLLLEQIPPSP